MDQQDRLLRREDETEFVCEIARAYNSSDVVYAPYWLRVGALVVGGAVAGQRLPGSTAASARWLAELTRNFDEEKAMASTLAVYASGRGQLYVLEGQHRTLAARKAKGDNYLLRYTVYFGFTGLDDVRIADLINTIHEERLPHTRDEKKLRDVVLGKTDAVELQAIESKLGIRIASTGNIRAVETCRRIVRQRGGEVLEKSIRIGVAAFGVGGQHITSDLLDGVSLFLSRYRHNVDPDRLVRVMQKAGSDGLHVMAAEFGGKGTGMCRALVRLYNRGLWKANRLPEE